MKAPGTLRDLLMDSSGYGELSTRQLETKVRTAVEKGRLNATINRATMAQILNGSYRKKPTDGTIGVVAYLAGFDDTVAFTAAGRRIPGRPFADDLPDGVDDLTTKELEAAVCMLRTLVNQRREVNRLEDQSTQNTPRHSPADGETRSEGAPMNDPGYVTLPDGVKLPIRVPGPGSGPLTLEVNPLHEGPAVFEEADMTPDDARALLGITTDDAAASARMTVIPEVCDDVYYWREYRGTYPNRLTAVGKARASLFDQRRRREWAEVLVFGAPRAHADLEHSDPTREVRSALDWVWERTFMHGTQIPASVARYPVGRKPALFYPPEDWVQNEGSLEEGDEGYRLATGSPLYPDILVLDGRLLNEATMQQLVSEAEAVVRPVPYDPADLHAARDVKGKSKGQAIRGATRNVGEESQKWLEGDD